jgi:hypothetical protein
MYIQIYSMDANCCLVVSVNSFKSDLIGFTSPFYLHNFNRYRLYREDDYFNVSFVLTAYKKYIRENVVSPQFSLQKPQNRFG